MVPLVKEKVDRAMDGRKTRREVGILQLEQPLRAGEHLLPAGDPLLDSRLGAEEGARDLLDAETAQEVEDERHLRLLAQPGMAAGEDHAQLIVFDDARLE